MADSVLITYPVVDKASIEHMEHFCQLCVRGNNSMLTVLVPRTHLSKSTKLFMTPIQQSDTGLWRGREERREPNRERPGHRHPSF